MYGYKRNNIVIVIVVAFLFLLIAGTVYFFFFSDYSEESSKLEEKKDSLYVEITDKNIINELQSTIENNNLYLLAQMEKDVDNMNSLESTYKLNMAIPTIIKNKENTEITTENIDEYFKNTFKTTMYWDKVNINCSCEKVLYKYDNLNNKYIYNSEHEPHDEIKTYPYYIKVLDAKKKNDVYILKVSYIWGNNDSAINKGFASYDDLVNEKNELFELDDSNLVNNYIEQNYESLKKKMHEYTYAFEKNNDKYLLISFNIKYN